MPAPRSAGLIAVVMAMASLLVPPDQAQARTQTGTQVAEHRQEDPSNLTELRKEGNDWVIVSCASHAFRCAA